MQLEVGAFHREQARRLADSPAGVGFSGAEFAEDDECARGSDYSRNMDK